MANIIPFRRGIAAFALIALPLSPLVACGSTPPSASRVCVGPEEVDDLEDLLDRDTVVHDPARCNGSDPAFSLVTVDGPAPAVGEELEPDGSTPGRYRRTSGHRGSVSASRVSTPSTPVAGATRANTAPSAGAPRTTTRTSARATTAPRVPAKATPRATRR